MEQNQESVKHLNYIVGDKVAHPKLSIDSYFTVKQIEPGRLLIEGHFSDKGVGFAGARWVQETEVFPVLLHMNYHNQEERLIALKHDIDLCKRIGLETLYDLEQQYETLADSIANPNKPIPRPPVGLKPRKWHNELRQQEIALAIDRYTDYGLAIPIEWIEEYNELVGWLKEHKN